MASKNSSRFQALFSVTSSTSHGPRPQTAGLTSLVFPLLLDPQAISEQRGPTHLDTQRMQQEWLSCNPHVQGRAH